MYKLISVLLLLSSTAYASVVVNSTTVHFNCEDIKGTPYSSTIFPMAHHTKNSDVSYGVYIYSAENNKFTLSIGDDIQKGYYYGIMRNTLNNAKFDVKCIKIND